jgi:hypothetical protein
MYIDRQTAMPSGTRYRVKAFAGRTFRRMGIGALAATLAAVAAPAMAQQQSIVKPGYAVVTGYSGFVAYPAPSGADPFDYLTINTSGASARVIDLTAPGSQGTLSAAPKTFTVTAAQVGQVFGVALDNAPQPNIYLAATSAYGLSIYTPSGSGLLKRQRQGSPGAQLVPGQFGPPAFGGGPGSIWRVSGATGQVSLFSAVGIGSLASLGGLAFDPATQQIFVADRGTGLIYRMGLDGIIKGKYDHGVEGRPGAGLAPVPLAPLPPVDINSPFFSTENPASWGFAPPSRRVFALAVYNNRLYYSIAQGPQIWSAGISASGSIPGKDARLEVEVPSLADGIEITSITFDGQGRMYLAERGSTAGDYYLYRLANGGQSRVLRYLPKPAGDPAPGRWKLLPEQYSVGLAPYYNNVDGGVALNYGYGQNGKINPGTCGANVWTTGERLLDPGNAQPGTFPYVDGLQGNANGLVQPQNVPPTAAWFVDYDDLPGNPSYRGYMGAIATVPCAVAPPPQPLPPPVTCPPGTYFYNGQCLIYPTCPPGTVFQNGQCVYPQCPPGYVYQQGVCVPPPQFCPPGEVFYQGKCVPLNCPPGLIRLPNGLCSCPANTIYVNGQCVPPNQCPPGAINLGGICFCPQGLFLQGNQCQPFSCPAGQILDIVQGKCVPVSCPPGQELKNGQCVQIVCKPNEDLFNNKCVPKCQPGWVHTMPAGVCAPLACNPPKEPFNGQCVNPCPPGWEHTMPNGVCQPMQPPQPCFPPKEIFNGQCLDPCVFPAQRQPDGSCKINIFCQPPNEMWNGICLPKCPQGQVHTPPNGQCQLAQPPQPPQCNPPKELFNGQCLDPCIFPTTRQPDGSCQLNLFCFPPNEMWNNLCVPKCPQGQVHVPPNGDCQGPPQPPPPPPSCDPPNEMWNNLCVPACGQGQVHVPPNGDCGLPPPPPPCPPPKEMWNGLCVSKCSPGKVHTPPNGKCEFQFQQIDPNLIQQLCLEPKELVNGQCVDPCPPNTTRQPDGSCKKTIQGGGGLQIDPNLIQKLCLAPKELVNGQCLDPCGENEVRRPDGTCGPKLLFNPNLLQQLQPLQLQQP